MKSLLKMTAVAASLMGAALFASAPANAGVHIGIGIGIPGVNVRVGGPAYYYGPGYYPPGPCDAYNYYYQGDCGYDVYNGPIYIDGAYIGGPHYYRWWGDQPYFWYRGGWHTWAGWSGVNFGWSHNEGWGWHGGHWDRGWGNAHGGHGGGFHGGGGGHHGGGHPPGHVVGGPGGHPPGGGHPGGGHPGGHGGPPPGGHGPHHI